MVWTLTIIMVIVLLLVLTFGSNLAKASSKELRALEAQPEGASDDSFVEEAYKVNLKKGFDISLTGEAPTPFDGIEQVRSATYALKPKDFEGMMPIPKVIPEAGTHVKAGDPLFFDKKRPDIMYVAPVSGEFIEIRRAEKRSIAEVVILADKEGVQYREYTLPDLKTASQAELVGFLLGSGVWPFIRQRPYDVVADHNEMPKAIFVSTFDTAPLAPNLNFAVQGKDAEFQKGLDVLNCLVPNVHLGLNGKGKPADAFANAKGVHRHQFSGQHPAGNVGIHIHHIDPINTGDIVWYLDVHAVILIGTLFTKGIYDTERVIALTGSETPNPRYIRAHQGVNLESFFRDVETETTETVKTKDGDKTITKPLVRIVSGDLLTGKKVKKDGFLGFFDDQVSTANEGDRYELFGWLVPQTGHPTISRTFPNGFFPKVKYPADTNTNGEKRAFVVSGQYESVLPMNIFPQHLMRAIQANDFERMEGLGLLELSEEDIAICEYVCTSKQPLQQILRKGLNMMREQG
ncbi:MAG: Na(+)-translocating NADH-quinone reductase subunit A [Aureispira sp.]|nr:Na(+)-translocating NADH-quinone reductase subunit A [Aureispira sp.]